MIEVINCAENTDIGEKTVLDFLMKSSLKTSGYHTILTNFYLPIGATTNEIDLVIINRFGIFLLEVKNWRGKIDADQIYWKRDSGEVFLSPITSIDKKIKVLHGMLTEKNPIYGRVSKVGFVILPHSNVELNISEHRKDRVFRLDDKFIDAITSRNFLFSRNCVTLERDNINELKDALLDGYKPPEKRFIGSYEIISELSRDSFYKEYQAINIHIKNKKARIKEYFLPGLSSYHEIQANLKKFKQDAEASSKLVGLNGFLDVYDFQRDPVTDDIYYLVTEWVDGKTLEDLISSGHKFSIKEVIKILGQLSEFISIAHDKGIIHRNICPQNIYITSDSQVKLTNFDFAKISDIGYTISSPNKIFLSGKYVAPELVVYAHNADERADIYSFGKLCLELINIIPKNIEVVKTEEIWLKSLKSIADKATQFRREDRFQHIDEIKKILG